MPKVHPYEQIQVHIIPDVERRTIGLRLWHTPRLVVTTTYPASAFPKVYF